MEVLTIELTLNLLLPHVVLIHVITCNFESTQTLLLWICWTQTLRTPLKSLDQQLQWLVMATTSTTPNLEFFQRIFPVEDFRKL